MNDDSELAKYLADYIMEEWDRQYHNYNGELDGAIDNFLDDMSQTLTNGIEAFRGGANESR